MTRSSRVAPALLLAAACGDPLKPPELIEEPRVIGGRVEVDAERARAWPAPGEGATVRWLVGFPAAKLPMTSGLLVCPGRPQSMGVPDCAGPPFATAVTEVPSTDEPALHFELPDEDALVGIDRALALGVLCSAGLPVLRESIRDSGCSDPAARPLRFSLEIGVTRDGVDNHNPDLSAAAVELDGEPWEPAAPADEAGAGCAGERARPAIAAGSGRHRISVTTSPDDREPIPAEDRREPLQLTYLTTGGELEHSYGVLEGDAEDDRLDVTWEAPADAPEAGRIVRLYLVGRDLRGGADWTERAACVVP